MSIKNSSNAFESALKGIDMLHNIDLVIVPLRPRMDMIEAGCAISGVSKAQARMVYEAMLRASLPSDRD